MVCAAKGYRCMLVMPESASIERRKIMQAYGAEILLTPAARATDGAIEKAYSMAREFPDRYFLTDQFNNEANWQAHYDRTGPEIWQQTDGRITHLVATLVYDLPDSVRSIPAVSGITKTMMPVTITTATVTTATG